MKNSILCCAFCLGLGMVVGGYIVSNNKKVRNILMGAQNKATQVCEDVKENLDEAISKAEEKVNDLKAKK